MINTVVNNEALKSLKTRPARKGAVASARNGGDLVAGLARKTSWAWKVSASYIN